MTALCKSRTFETTSVCPNCGTIDVHYLRRPRVCLVHPVRGGGQTTTEIRAYGMSKVIRSIHHPPPGWYDETPCDCSCEWGQS